jgi:hypothetical protein
MKNKKLIIASLILFLSLTAMSLADCRMFGHGLRGSHAVIYGLTLAIATVGSVFIVVFGYINAFRLTAKSIFFGFLIPLIVLFYVIAIHNFSVHYCQP